MRIDDRKVNGRITIDREDTICTWVVLVNRQVVFGSQKSIKRSQS